MEIGAYLVIIKNNISIFLSGFSGGDILMISIGLGITTAALVPIIIKLVYRPSLIDLLGRKTREKIQSAATKDAFARWVDDLEKYQKKGNIGLTGWKFWLLFVALVLASFVGGIIIFESLVLAVFLVVATILLLDQYFMFKERSVKEAMESQLAVAIRLFASSYTTTPQVERGIAAVAATCPNPLGKIFRKADKMLKARIPLDTVLIEMAREMNFDYGIMFIQLIKQVRNNTLIMPLFHELISRITAREILTRENRSQVDGERMLSLIMVAAPLPSYLLIQNMVPDAHEFLSGTFFGRVVICMVFISAITWAVMSRITERVDA